MALIGKNNIRYADIAIAWPNPFRLKESEIIGVIKDLPIEIVTLALIETIRQRPHLENPLSELRSSGLNGSFSWYETIDNRDFWSNIHKRNFDTFYKIYTPTKLLERVKELKNIDYKWERKINI